MKLTRRSYNRRIYTFGILSFLGVALISTGFAAWVMSTNADTEETGSASVGVVTDGQLSFVKNSEQKFVTFTGDNEFRFDSSKDDDEGEIKASQLPDAEYENLSVQFHVTITPAEYLAGLNVKLELPDTYYDAASANYIVLPDCASTDGVTIDPTKTNSFTNDVVTMNTVDTNITITYTINFKWGSAFGGVNPGVYLDEYRDDLNNSLDYSEKVARLAGFKKTIHGLDDSVSNNDALKETSNDTYTLKLEAISK